MATIKSKNNGIIMVKDLMACGDVLMEVENINGTNYEIYLGFNGYPYFYAVEKK